MKKILLVIDVQKGFSRYEQMQVMAKKILELTNSGHFDTIIATRFINYEGSPYTRMLGWHRLIDSPDIDLIDGIKYDTIIDKNIYTCVNNKFIKLLQEVNDGELPSHLFLCGADTDCCVLKIAADLFEVSIMPLILVNYCNSNGGPDSHEAGQVVLKRLVGQKSLIYDDIISKEQLEKIVKCNQH